MTRKELHEAQIVQLNPETVNNKAFAACFMVVTEMKDFGAVGYVMVPQAEGAAQAFYRANWEEMEETGGAAIWLME